MNIKFPSSTQIIKFANLRYKDLERKNYDSRSFKSGFLEGYFHAIGYFEILEYIKKRPIQFEEDQDNLNKNNK